MKQIFEYAAGSVAGRDHVRAGKNNHDAYAIRQTDSVTVALVCDGCGSGKHSEVGAKLGAELVVQAVLDRAEIWLANRESGGPKDFPWERVRVDVLAQMRVMALRMGSSLSAVVNDYFLFTIVGALITPAGVVIFGIGDGLFCLNGELVNIAPLEGNEPPYLAYGLVETSLGETHPELLKFRIHRQVPTEGVRHLLLGTDGVGDFVQVSDQQFPATSSNIGSISQFWIGEKFFTNKDKVRRVLMRVSKDKQKVVDGRPVNHPGLLNDDTTLISIRRKR